MVASLKHMKYKNDRVHNIVTSVLKMDIPQEGQLSNPFKPKRKTDKQTSLDQMINRRSPSSLPDSISEWTNKNFVTHFARCYQNYLGGNYKITFTSDLPIIKQIGDFFHSNGLDRNEYTKKLIDWSFENQEHIVRKFGYITLQSVLASINYFYQDQILPKVENGDIVRNSNDTSLLKEIEELQKNVKPTELFARFGLPITVTYLCKIRNYEYLKIVSTLHSRFGDEIKPGDVELLERIFNSSIINSPYPEGFLAKDWREEFGSLCSMFKTETWWRDNDYKGNYLDKYNSLLGGK